MKVSEFTKYLSGRGCYLLHHGGEHDIWVNPVNNKTASLPRHNSKDLPDGTMRSIKRRLGL
jgi:predicted RNA binding protein YcfA (HicA-like mRNA interferase family)